MILAIKGVFQNIKSMLIIENVIYASFLSINGMIFDKVVWFSKKYALALSRKMNSCSISNMRCLSCS